MKLQTLKFICLVGIISVLLFSCKKEPEKKPVYFDDEFKRTFNYQVGTYWVFYDSLNNRLDSLVVLNNEYFKPFSTSQPSEFYNISMHFFNSVSDTESTFLNIQLTAPYYSVLFLVYTTNATNVEFEYPAEFLQKTPFETGATNISGSGFVGFCKRTFIGNLQIGSKIYKNVYRIEYNDTHVPTMDVFYFNMEYGFLEILFDNQFMKRKLYLQHSHKM